MKIIRIKGRIKLEDIEKINKIAPVIVEFDSTVGQNTRLLRELSNDCIIRINPGDEISSYEKASGRKIMTYSKNAFIDLLNSFEEIEKGIDSNWSNLEKATYLYKSFQEISHVSNLDYKSAYDLSGMLSRETDSAGFASIFYEAMRRNNIPCRYIYNNNFDAWNEIQIENTFYPLDLAKDADAFFNKNSAKQPSFSNFLTNQEFYYMPEHNTEMVDAREVRALSREEVEKAIDKVIYNENNKNGREEDKEDKLPEKPIERKRIEIKSKELSGIFDGNEITEDTLKKELPELRISISDNSYAELKTELEEISTYYPELLKKVEITNSTSNHISMQEVVDKVYEVQSSNEFTRQQPITLTISSNIAEDFDLDLSKVPSVPNRNYRVDGQKSYQTISFKNTDSNTSLLIPNFGLKWSDNIEAISFEGIDLSNVSIDPRSSTKKIILNGGNTIHITGVAGLDTIPALEINRNR